jgi:hypothetical protein
MTKHSSSPPVLALGVIALLITSGTPSFAQDAASQPKKDASAPQPEAPVMIIDPDSKAFRFIIDGKEVARLDEHGLHVRENIEYGGMITDVGVDSYNKAPTAPQGAAQ